MSEAFLLIGSVFMLLAGLGLLRLPDVYMRLQAASKAVTMGVGLMTVGIALHFDAPGGLLRALSIFLFMYFSAPVAAHVLGRVAYFMELPLWGRTTVDDLRPVFRRGVDHGTPQALRED